MRTILAIREAAKAAGKGTQHIRVENGSWMTLTIEEIGTGPNGLPAISVCHYGEQNGDLMRDPDVCFELCEGLRGGGVEMYPFSYRNDYLGIDREVYSTVDDKRMVNVKEKKDQAAFARTWDRNLKEQGFLEAYKASIAAVKS